MSVHLDLTKDKQWDSRKPKPKEKSCNVISVLPDDDNVTIVSLSDSEDEKHALATQDVAVDCLKITEDKSLKSRIQTPNTRLVIATSAALRREG